MNRLTTTFTLSLLLLFAFTHAQDAGKKGKKRSEMTTQFGAAITKDGAIQTAELVKFLGDKESAAVKVTGKIKEVCSVKGCWMTADLADGKSMRVTFKDYGFFVPKDAGGKTFWADGEVKMKTTSVEMLKHYAEDAGKSAAEIEAIKEPKRELVFVANGVIVE